MVTPAQKEMTEADLDKEIGEAKGWAHIAYRKWCIDQPDLVVLVGENELRDASALFSRVYPTTADLFANLVAKTNATAENVKDEAKAKSWREKGNDEYNSKKFLQAICSYTESAKFAPQESEALALAYANRSAVLLHLGEDVAVMQDLDRALAGKYPVEKRYKLLERRTKCLLNLGQVEQVEKSLKKFIESFADSGLSKEKERAVVMSLQKVIDKKRQAAGSIKISRTDWDYSELHLPKVPNASTEFPAFSRSVNIKYRDEKGRHAMATRKINAGELICVDKPIVACLSRQEVGKVCTHCFRSSLNPLPSPITTMDIFCSPACLDLAMASYHPTESIMYGLLNSSELAKTEWFLSLRAVTQKSADFFTKDPEGIFDHYDPKLLGSEPRPYLSKDYRSLYNLISAREKWDSATLLFESFVVSFFVRCLKRAGYISEKDTNETSDEEMKIGLVLSHLMEICTLNSYEVGLFTALPSQPWNAGGLRDIGCTVDPSLDMLNHSCDPNTVRVNVGNGTLVYAARTIKEDEEVTSSYLSTPLVQAVPWRQSELQRKYHFFCQCAACGGGWTPAAQLPRALADTPPERFKFALDDVRRMQAQFAKIQKLGASINAELKAESYSSCLALAIEFLKTIEETIEKPHQFYEMAKKTIFSCLWMMRGSKKREIPSA